MRKRILTLIFSVLFIMPSILLLSACGKEAQRPTRYSITYDYGEAKNMFNNVVDSTSVEPDQWLESIPTIKDEFTTAFLGWFIEGSDKQIGLYDNISGDLTLEARFDTSSTSSPSGLYSNGKYVKTWSTLKSEYSAAFKRVNSIISDSRYISRSFFDNLEGELVIDCSITIIDDKAFYGCTGLKSVLIPNSVTELGISSFEGCTGLKTIIIPNSIMVIPYGTFYRCTSLTNLTVEAKSGYKWQKQEYGVFDWVDVNLNLESLLDLVKEDVALKRVEI